MSESWDDPTLEEDLAAILDRPDAEQLFPRAITQAMLDSVRDTKARMARLAEAMLAEPEADAVTIHIPRVPSTSEGEGA